MSASNVEMNEAAQVANSGVVPPANRLVIEKIVMENFKSYAGVREIGPFHKVRFFDMFHCTYTQITI